MVTVAGPPSSGKTSMLVHAILELDDRLDATAVIKFDCLVSDDADRYRRAGITSFAGFSAGQCPDHFFASNAPAVFSWGIEQGLDLLVTESAGLCNRCSPYIVGVPAICVVDCLSGMSAPRKIGPLLKMADLVVVAKGDMVSQAEREVFAYRVQTLAPKAQVVSVNGLTGQGALQVARFLQEAPAVDTLDERELRFSMPSALCSYCLGETHLGESHQMGNIRRIELS